MRLSTIKSFTLCLFFISLFISCKQKQETHSWKYAEAPLLTKWAETINPENVWKEYPRPQMVRPDWINLNGLWDFDIVPIDSLPSFDGDKILVPFPVESALSRIGKSPGVENTIWYKRNITIPEEWDHQIVLLHVEASDWKTTLWIDDNKVGIHKGGYDPFYFDISDFVEAGNNYELKISVWDPTNEGYQPRGKQINDPGGIFYTPSSGIWQTVWLEPVPESYIKDFTITTDVNNSKILINTEVINPGSKDEILVQVFDNKQEIQTGTFVHGQLVELEIPEPKLWSPDDPFLYDIKISLYRENTVIDEVESYFGMRKISVVKDDKGFNRLALSNNILFQNGPLDQGFWPDGLNTPPSDEAMRYDIEITKAMGFNMLRKHVKVENRRFYYWCDKLGILVWQDMPNADGYVPPGGEDLNPSTEHKKQFEQELTQLIHSHFNNPSIVMWVPFNEGWGQYETERIVELVNELDSTRLVNNASGWEDRNVGDVIDIHHYPDPRFPNPEVDRASVLGEFGGLGLFVENHTWQKENWGYRQMNDKNELLAKYEEFYTDVWRYKEEEGLAATVYTQTADVETETNGLMTYDRKVIKADVEILKKINTNKYVPRPRILPEGAMFYKTSTIEIENRNKGDIYYTVDGTEPTRNSKLYEKPVVLAENTIVKAKTFRNEGESFTVESEFIKSKIKPPLYKSSYVDRYSAGGDFALVNGKRGTERFHDGNWQGFQGEDLEIIIELEKIKQLNKLSAGFLKDHGSWIFLPEKVVFFISLNGVDFKEIKRFDIGIAEKEEEKGIQEFTTELTEEVLFIKVMASNIKTCPDWHKGSGDKAWVFCDEIVYNVH